LSGSALNAAGGQKKQSVSSKKETPCSFTQAAPLAKKTASMINKET